MTEYESNDLEAENYEEEEQVDELLIALENKNLNYFDKEKIEIQSGQQNLSGSGSQESINNNSVQTKSEDIIIKGLIETINYSQNYFYGENIQYVSPIS